MAGGGEKEKRASATPWSSHVVDTGTAGAIFIDRRTSILKFDFLMHIFGDYAIDNRHIF